MSKKNQLKGQTKRNQNLKCDVESEVKDSDEYCDSPTPSASGFDFPSASEEFRTNLKKEFGKEILKLAVDELRHEFKQMAIDGAKLGAHMALHGDSMSELQNEITKKEGEIKQLKIEKTDLENELNQQKIKNKELELLITQKEDEIRVKEGQLRETKRLLKKLEREQKNELELRAQKERKLEAEIKNLKEKQNNLKGKLLAKDASDNVAKTELAKLRAKMADLEDQATKKKK